MDDNNEKNTLKKNKEEKKLKNDLTADRSDRNFMPDQ